MRDHFFSLQYVPDWFVTQQQLKIWHDVSEYDHDDEIIKWYDGYKNCRALKIKAENELMLTACHPLKWWDWCMSENKKNRQKNCGSNR